MTAYIELHTGRTDTPSPTVVNIFNALVISETTDGQAFIEFTRDPEDRLWPHESYAEIKNLIAAAGYFVVSAQPHRPISDREG